MNDSRPIVTSAARFYFLTFFLSTLLPITPPATPPTTPPTIAPFSLSLLVAAPMTAPAAAPIAASRCVCFTVVVPELVVVVPLVVGALEFPPELDPLELERRVVVLRGALDVGAGAKGATVTGAVAAARSAADIESSVA